MAGARAGPSTGSALRIFLPAQLSIVVVIVLNVLLLGGQVDARSLALSGIVVWLINVVIFALCYWDLDRGGPGARARGEDSPCDFQFPRMTDDRLRVGWHSEFMDYLYVSFTNSSAFGPTDTMPLSRRAKGLMLVQGLASLTTLALVVAFAINILA